MSTMQKGVEVKAKTESHCVHVINCVNSALSSSVKFLPENRPPQLRIVVVFFRLCRPLLPLEVTHTYIAVSTSFLKYIPTTRKNNSWSWWSVFKLNRRQCEI